MTKIELQNNPLWRHFSYVITITSPK